MPPDAAAWEMDMVGTLLAYPYNGADLVPTQRCKILNPNLVADLQFGKGMGMRVVVHLDILFTFGSSSVAQFCLGLPLLQEEL